MIAKKILLYSLAFSAMGVIYSCSDDSFEELHPEVYNSTPLPCDSTDMTYDGEIKALFLTHCGSDRTSCHKAPNTQDINLDNYFDAKDLGDNGDLMGAVLHQSGWEPMPDGGSMLDDCTISKLQNWVHNGCPEN